MKTAKKGVTAKIFVGLQLTPDIKILLNQSKEWHNSALDAVPSAAFKLQVIHYQSKEYFGTHIEQSVSMNELKMTLLLCLDQYKLYFPDAHIDASKLVIFPQIFIS